MEDQLGSRRDFLRLGIVGVSSAAVIAACQTGDVKPAVEEKKQPDAKEVTAVEDLMREHGILRRALLVYGEAAVRLRKNASSVAPNALKKTANLFRTFGEDYHEKKLEEAYLFPRIKQKSANSDAAKYVDVLVAQHDIGRKVTDHILSVTNGPKIGADAAKFADTLIAFVRMYEHHAAREDTIIFPAWKDVVTSTEYDELNDKFEDIEHEQFGEDGFADAAKQISDIETSLGLSDISQFTMTSPK